MIYNLCESGVIPTDFRRDHRRPPRNRHREYCRTSCLPRCTWKTLFNCPSRLIWALLSSPVARARSFNPFTLLASEKSAADFAPFCLTIPYGKNCQIIHFYILSIQNKFLGAGNHIRQHSLWWHHLSRGYCG